jgi:hypothetical protein
VRPWGWTWVDDASWGFAPFHYGRWVSFRGRWCWAPGTYVRRPVYAPAMVAWVGGPHVSVSVHIGGGQPVGWVPLAPREVYYPAYRVSPVYVRQVNITHVHVTQNIIVKPSRPVMYANTNVKGGVTMVSSDVLTRRQAIGTATRVNDDVAIREIRKQHGAVAVAPPTPANASFAPRTARQPGREADVPPPRSAMPPSRQAAGNDNERGPRASVEARDNSRDSARDSSRDSARENARDNVREPQAAPRVARPPLANAPGREANRDATQGIPQARRETNDAPPAHVSPREQRDREQRDTREQAHQREAPRQPTPQQAAPQRPMPQAPTPRAVPQREERPVEPQPRHVERQERQVERQPERQIERPQDRRERQEQRHEQPNKRDDRRDKRDGPNALN